ncbi:dihydroxyacetone kinase [Wickerhamomyces ciferrii]|uniref:Dihydroxyacetone kinase n=1 Tax=Wickerhamomyces ciferrii (strain ATCC 14091 / BCRC 22168 / CBS 111 / JCM 3599 / NBRC 0793 / NRRL Y-1031 F-60-10) TaxID=1206466 RepID=K0KGV1_WICCF|nr:dihydroxyacetone kinase [Wickerhamomyces ciferrii]CCH40629.1 dihydroxyacetone kinase [Wickerhamomyces ciferrii]
MTKHFTVENTVESALEGLALSNPSLTYVKEDKVIFRDQDKSKVALISGGGAGHEPTHAGFVGKGGLTGAVSGPIFASPSTKQILNGIKLVGQDKPGVLLIVKNYTGDVLHFGLAGERARALGYNVEVFVIGEDVSVGRSKGGLVGRRALAGTPIIHKSLGAYVENYKHTLKDAVKLATALNDNLVSIGASLNHAKVPGQEFESSLKDDEMELGMGIHNEPGVKTLKPVPSVEELIKTQMLPKLLDQSDKDRAFVNFEKGDEVVLLINNLGGVANLVLQAITKVAADLLKSEYDITPSRVYAGTLISALDGEGFSITLLNVTKANKSAPSEVKSVVDLLDAETEAAGWPAKRVETKAPTYDPELIKESDDSTQQAGTYDFDHFSKVLKAGTETLIKAEPEITRLDTKVGDGDCGTTLVAGAEGIVKNLDKLPKHSLAATFHKLSNLLEELCGGTMGALLSIYFSGLSQGVEKNSSKGTPVDPTTFGKALQDALDTLYKYTNARPGDSTIIDALEPFVKEFVKSSDFSKAVAAADKGAQATGSSEAKFGRASYVGDSSDIPDPGAIGLVEFLKGIESAF